MLHVETTKRENENSKWPTWNDDDIPEDARQETHVYHGPSQSMQPVHTEVRWRVDTDESGHR